MKKIVMTFIAAIILNLNSPSELYAANKLNNASVSAFLEKYKAVINSARETSLNQFFRFYGMAQSKYVITSYYVDPNKNEELISQEQREMNREQFIDFLKKSFIDASKYQYIQEVGNITVNSANDTAAVKFNYTENILINTLIKGEVVSQSYQKVYANCNMNLIVETSDINIAGLNCIRKIAIKPMKS